MSNPNNLHFKALDRIQKYLNKYPSLGLYYNYNNINNILKGYCNSNQGSDINTRRSTSSFIFFYNNNIISQNTTL